MKELEDIFNIKIDNPEYFRRALTHPSYTKENNLSYLENYERLEFLGDAVLKLAASDILYKKFPNYQEGDLSKIRSIVVSDSTLFKIASRIGLCDLIIVAHHEAKQGLSHIESVCACSFEAVLGAYYLDGKFKKLIPFLTEVLMPYIIDVDKNFEKFNAKALLQEYTQSLTKETPIYSLVSETGPDHNKTFTVEVSYSGKKISEGSGKTKKEAEQNAAYQACKILGVVNNG